MFSFNFKNKITGFGKGVGVEIFFGIEKTKFGVEFYPWKNQHGFGFQFSLLLGILVFDFDLFLDRKA